MSKHTLETVSPAADAARVEALERRLAARPAVEKALFDGSWVSYPMLLVVGAIWGVELAANLARGEGWSATAHLLVIVPLELALLVALGLGFRTLLLQARLARLRRRKPSGEPAPTGDPT